MPQLVFVAFEAAAANASLAANETETPRERPLPHEWLPSASACALLFVVFTLNALFYLGCHWSVGFKARALFAPLAGAPCDGAFLLFLPLQHKGRAALVKLARSKRTGRLVCEFQRQKYEVLPLADALADPSPEEALSAAEGAEWAVRLIRCPVGLPVQEYTTGAGLVDSEAVSASTEQFGPNVLSVPTPRFIDLCAEIAAC